MGITFSLHCSVGSPRVAKVGEIKAGKCGVSLVCGPELEPTEKGGRQKAVELCVSNLSTSCF